MSLLKAILIVLGTVSLLAGAIGIFVPGLPTTPFLLLTSVLYVHSSDKLYKLLISNKRVGAYILNFRSNKGMTRKLKIYSICIMWVMITISCLFFIPTLSIKLIVAVLGLTGSFVMGIVVPTISK
jgi:uncharacterized membrane protein YbaN (DUF454 family)